MTHLQLKPYGGYLLIVRCMYCSYNMYNMYHTFMYDTIYRYTTQKKKFYIKYLFSKCDQIRRKLWIWSHLLNKSLMENFIFRAVSFSLTLRQKYLVISHLINCLVDCPWKSSEFHRWAWWEYKIALHRFPSANIQFFGKPV